MPRELKINPELEYRIIGKAICKLRIAAGMSRDRLAEKIDVSGYQLSKYEKGLNKISIPRLALVAKIFSKPITYFFEPTEYTEDEHQRLCIELVRNFSKIKDRNLREIVNDLAKNLAK